MLRKTCSSREGSTAQCRSRPSISSRSTASRPSRRGPGASTPAPDLGQVAGPPLEADRGRIAPDILVEGEEVVLRLLEPSDEVEGFGPILDLQREHLQAHLAAIQGVAALVGQAGDHLADGRQPFGLQRPLLGRPQFRDVVADREDADDATRGP